MCVCQISLKKLNNIWYKGIVENNHSEKKNQNQSKTLLYGKFTTIKKNASETNQLVKNIKNGMTSNQSISTTELLQFLTDIETNIDDHETDFRKLLLYSLMKN